MASPTSAATGQGNPASPDAPQPYRGRMPGLDGVRGIAIAMVMAVHFVGDIPAEGRFEHWLVRAAVFGVYGVDLFFVLSGFLITGLLFDSKEGAAYYRNFYARRTLRIFPLYYAVLLLLFVVGPFVFGPYSGALETARAGQVWLWTYLANFYIAAKGTWTAMPYVGHFWSLAVEEHFYLVWPLVIRSLERAAAIRACLVLIVGSLLLRLGLQAAGVPSFATYMLTPCRLDYLCTGAMLALVVRSEAGFQLARRLSLSRWVFPAACIAFVPISRLASGPLAAVCLEVRATLLALIFGLLVVRAVVADERSFSGRLFRAAPLRFLGKYSYGLYVYHGILAFAVFHDGVFPWLLQVLGNRTLAIVVETVGGVGASLLISMISFELFERKVLKLKSRFESAA